MIELLLATSLFSSGASQDFGWPAQVVLECREQAKTTLSRPDDGSWGFAPADIVQASYTVAIDIANGTVQGDNVASVRAQEGSITIEHWASFLIEDSPPNPISHYIAQPDAREGLLITLGASSAGAGVTASHCRRIDEADAA